MSIIKAVVVLLPLISCAFCLVPGLYFNRIFIINFENQGYDDVIKDEYFKQLASQGTLLTNSYAVVHPSQPNYIAQVAGSTLGVSSDSNYNLVNTSVVNLLEAAGISWKGYMEDYPGSCFTGATSGLYARKHNPFISFDDVRNHTAWCAKIVNADQLDTDISSDSVPQFSYYTPNLNNDGHDTSIAYSSAWLKKFLEPKLTNANFINGTAILLTYDEDDGKENNHIYTALLGPTVKVGVIDNTKYTQYSVLKSVETNWGLPSLGRLDVDATSFAATNFK